MAEFQEQQLFKGATQSRGFDPVQAPDTSRYLRENMGRIDANFARIQNQQKTAMDAELKKQQDILSTLGQFSETAMKFATTMSKAYVDSEVLKGHAKARSLGKNLNYGIPAETQQKYDSIVADAEKESSMLGAVKQEAVTNNNPQEYINYISSLSSYQQIGATRAYLKNRANTYESFIDNFLQRTDIKIAAPGNRQITPKEAFGDPALMPSVLDAASRIFDAEVVGINADFNPSTVASKELYQIKDTVEDKFMLQAQKAKAISDSNRISREAVDGFAADKNVNILFNTLIGSYDSKLKRARNRTDVLDYLFNDVLPDLYSSGTKDIINILKTTNIDGDPKNKTWYDQFEKVRINNVDGLQDKLNKIDSRERTAKSVERSAKKDELNERLIEFIQNDWDGNPDTLRAAQAEMTKAANDNGIYDYTASVANPYISTATRKQNREFIVDQLTSSKNNLTLSVKDLMSPNVPADVRQSFMQAAKEQDAIRARIVPDTKVEKDLNTALKQTLGDASLEKNYIGLQAATFAAMRIYRQKVMEKYPALGAEAASEQAIAEVTKMIMNKEGVFSVADWKDKAVGSKPISFWPAFTPRSSFTSDGSYDRVGTIELYRKKPSIIEDIPIVPLEVLKEVERQIRAGEAVDIPGIFFELGGDPVELLNKNLGAINSKERMKPLPSTAVGSSTNDEALKRLARKARSVFDQQRVQAAASGGTTDRAFMNPRVVQYVSADPAIRGMNTGRIVYDRLGHGGAEYHNHYEFENEEQARVAIQRFEKAGFRVSSYIRKGDPGAHGRGVAVDVAPPVELPYTDEAEREWSARANAVIGFDPLENNN